MHFGGSHTTHITGSNAVDGDRAADKPAPSQGGSVVPSILHATPLVKMTDGRWRAVDSLCGYDMRGHLDEATGDPRLVTCKRCLKSRAWFAFVKLSLDYLTDQSFQNTRHGQAYPDRFSAPVCCFNHSQADSAGEARNNG